MKQYVGRFPVNASLSKALNYKDYVIYRDPDYGLYAYSAKEDKEIPLYIWNLKVADFDENERSVIIETIEDYKEC